MALKLITEVNMCDVQTTLVEGLDGKPKSYFIEGIFMQGNIKNQNGRVYPTKILARECVRYQKEYIDQTRAWGELGHPESPTINGPLISHRITELHQQGDNFIGKAKILPTPNGRIVEALLDDGGKLGVSSRGLGSLVETDQGMEVQPDFYFSAVDIVMDPSAPNAFVRGIMESKEWVWESGVLKERVLVDMAERIDAAHAPTVPTEVRKATFVEEYKHFLTALRHGVKSNIQ